MPKYHDVVVRFVMRDCADHRDAVRQLIRLLPHHPDESTIYIESWDVDAVSEAGGTTFDRSSRHAEAALDDLIYAAEDHR
jgi:hypothetical protein